MANWKEIRDKRVGGRPELEESIRRQRRLVELDTKLAELRCRRGVSQRSLADLIGVSQPNVHRIEREDDLLLSTLAGYISGLGGRLEVHAVFDDEDVRLTKV
jgi:DNA-binding XRE family transcriptional regulator